MHDLDPMAKSPAQDPKIARNASIGRYVSIGRTSDGVTVLKSSKPSNHFTLREARGAIAARLEAASQK
ncbi:MAG: hypothetical protein ACK4MI_09355 [Brevundimonas sp.]|uniref:hypothetical protein n=1 Tax=Brevundimonas sp. TaxID=1871086 RepID=UPI0028D0B194|nr:hypothetical protein [uncultured Brevundimonas sp.]